jgi:hypothetical protein
MGWSEVVDQGLAGLMLQLLQGWGRDAERRGISPGFEVARAFRQDAEDNLAHAGMISVVRHSSLVSANDLAGDGRYGEPAR